MFQENDKKTADVEPDNNVSFRDMMLSDQVLAGLTKCNFEKPSPIQLRAIPLGRCGLDLIIQSKSGTGKTLVYCTIILERYNPDIKTPQSLIVVPTREIALQIENYLNSIGSNCKDFNATCVIGGRDIFEDRKRISKSKSIVGTPGRILHLIKNNYVCMKNIQIFVLDEADKLVSEDFYGDINQFLNALNKNRQIIATSATYANDLDKLIVSFMHNPIAISTARDTPVLIGVKQFILPVEKFDIPSSVQNSTPSIQGMWRKVIAVEYILSTTSFKQCILFSNSQLRATSFANCLIQNKWTVELVLGSHDQETRTATLQRFRQYKCRILVTSDLMARGVDIVNVNLVINLDVPSDSSTYLHRIGRCGRFGRRGLAITLSSDDTEMEKFQKLLNIIGGNKLKVATFPTTLNSGAKYDVWNSNEDTQLDDSYIFDSIDYNDNDKSMVVNMKQTNENKEQKLKDKVEEDLIKAKNLNLLDVAKLLIDVDSKEKDDVVNVDEDLFSNYQASSIEDSTQCEIPHSADIFDDFQQIQSNENVEESNNQCTSSGDDNFDDFTQFQSNENAEELNDQCSSDTKSHAIVDCVEENIALHLDSDEENDAPDESIQTEMSKSIKKEPTTKTIPESSKICKNPQQTYKKSIQINNITLPQMANNNFWIRMYQQQVNDINQYVQVSLLRNK